MQDLKMRDFLGMRRAFVVRYGEHLADMSRLFNEYAASTDICAYGRFMCIPLEYLNEILASVL